MCGLTATAVSATATTVPAFASDMMQTANIAHPSSESAFVRGWCSALIHAAHKG